MWLAGRLLRRRDTSTGPTKLCGQTSQSKIRRARNETPAQGNQGQNQVIYAARE
jgi:hypothetical protein